MTDPEPAQQWSASDDLGAPGDGRDYLIRSEERLRVSTQRVPAGFARLEKFLVTETKTITVEVTHEEFRLVQVAADAPQAGGRQTNRAGQLNTARWMYLNREEIVVSKRVVPTERVRLEVYPVTEQQQVTEQVRKEQIRDAPPHPDHQ